MPRRARVLLTFDVEDPVTPASDDAVKWLADMLRKRGVSGAFFLTGDKARALVRRQRHDVFEALRTHDIGYHTNHHSTHPTVAEYLAPLDWAKGVAEVVAQERSGADLIRDLTGRDLCGFATAGTSWGPQVPGALSALGVPAHLHSFSRTGGGHNPHWYAGALCFARSEAVGPVEDFLPDPVRFAELIGRIPGMIEQAARSEDGVVHLYIGHPTMFVHREFWDAANYAGGCNPPPGAPLVAPGRRPPAETRTMLDNLARLIDVLHASPAAEFVAFGEMVAALRRRPGLDAGWFGSALGEAAGPGIRTTSRVLSPAQLLYAMCRELTGEDVERAGAVPEILGPVALPDSDHVPGHPDRLDATRLREAGASVCREVSATGALPALAAADGIAVPVAALYRCLLGLTADGSVRGLRSLPEAVPVSVTPELPEVAEEISEHYLRRVRRWMHRPDLDVTGLARITRAQTWSLRATALA
ncbi:polysaccharide deacetylase family protein [Streptomyces sp. NPDC007861]|uniref:polysaccharide deacetylase family protein n=1 Tax=Streptomyces sp. NPDC007861 TaxID=3154893 RepID=UPI0033F20955